MSQPIINTVSSVKNLHIQVNNLFNVEHEAKHPDTHRITERVNADKEFLTKKNSLAQVSNHVSITDYVSFLQGHSIQGG